MTFYTDSEVLCPACIKALFSMFSRADAPYAQLGPSLFERWKSAALRFSIIPDEELHIDFFGQWNFAWLFA